jgi:hypothetical protein
VCRYAVREKEYKEVAFCLGVRMKTVDILFTRFAGNSGSECNMVGILKTAVSVGIFPLKN